MAESQYALRLTDINGSTMFIDTGLDSGQPASETLAKPLAELKLAIVNVGQDIRLLIKEQIKLREVLAAQQSLSKGSAPASAAASEPTSSQRQRWSNGRFPVFSSLPRRCNRPWRNCGKSRVLVATSRAWSRPISSWPLKNR